MCKVWVGLGVGNCDRACVGSVYVCVCEVSYMCLCALCFACECERFCERNVWVAAKHTNEQKQEEGKQEPRLEKA